MSENNSVIGVFIGLESSSYEYIANIIAPYRTNFVLAIGDFLLIENAGSYLVARVTEYRPTGELTAFMGQKWLGDVADNLDAIGLDIKEKKIRYTVRIKVLGSLENDTFKPGLSRIPHITSKVYKPDIAQLRTIISSANNLQASGQEIGSLFSSAEIQVKFDEAQLNSKRTFIFARAGYGKSNLMKLIASHWPVGHGGLLVFDPEGEYATTDVNRRPGIMDYREAILITNRDMPQTLGNVYRYTRLNLKDFAPEFVVPVLVNSGKHETVFFSKLMGLSREEWGEIVDLVSDGGWRTSVDEIARIIRGEDGDDGSNFQPILNNLVGPIRKLHDANSHLLDIIHEALRQGRLVIFDISLLDSQTALQTSSLIVKSVFDHNQQNFAGQRRDIIKATFVVEEAQSVIGTSSNIASFVELAKEGRKYSLGGIFITQEPGSIPFEILSQSDNFFVFHLLSRWDLDNLRKANAHYSEDVITQILSEPIKGKCYMWTSEQPFVLPLMITNFETIASRDRSEAVQRASSLLRDLLAHIQNEANNPLMGSIVNKYNEVDTTMSDDDIGARTVALFGKLTEEEKAFLREKDFIQTRKNDGKEFAVKTSFYNSLKK